MCAEGTLVSAVIVTHNRKDILLKSIESVLTQSYPNVECIVVDDKSTDGTADAVAELNDGRIQYIYIPAEESKGGNHARNVGLRAANGKYVAFLDDDDFWLPEKTALQLEAFASSPKVKMVYCFRYFFYKSRYCWIDGAKDPSVGDVSKTTFEKIITSTSTMMFEREALLDIGGFDEGLGFWQETELMMRFSQKYEIGCVEQPLLLYTVNLSDPNKLSNKYEEWKKAIEYIEKKHADILSGFSAEQRKRWELMVCRDAINRCNTKKLRAQRRALYDEACRLSPSLTMRVKRTLNYQATSHATLSLRACMARLNLLGCCLVERIIK